MPLNWLVTGWKTPARCLRLARRSRPRFTGLDRKSRNITLSIKAKEAYEEAEAVQSYQREVSAGTSLGDLLKEQIAGKDNGDKRTSARPNGRADMHFGLDSSLIVDTVGKCLNNNGLKIRLGCGPK